MRLPGRSGCNGVTQQQYSSRELVLRQRAQPQFPAGLNYPKATTTQVDATVKRKVPLPNAMPLESGERTLLAHSKSIRNQPLSPLQLQRLKFNLLVMCHNFPASGSGSLESISRWLQVKDFKDLSFFFLLCVV